MLKRLTTILFSLFICSSISAKHSDDFLNGNYSGWRHYNPLIMFDFLEQCGYNSTTVELRNEDETAARNRQDYNFYPWIM